MSQERLFRFGWMIPSRRKGHDLRTTCESGHDARISGNDAFAQRSKGRLWEFEKHSAPRECVDRGGLCSLVVVLVVYGFVGCIVWVESTNNQIVSLDAAASANNGIFFAFRDRTRTLRREKILFRTRDFPFGIENADG